MNYSQMNCSNAKRIPKGLMVITSFFMYSFTLWLMFFNKSMNNDGKFEEYSEIFKKVSRVGMIYSALLFLYSYFG